uniref:SKA complex subunit 1 n=1 Tax=Cyprinus carpio TaxID=7962 RepID=A0A8C1KKK2_CYPCA
MNHCELEEVTQHINDKISMIRRLLELRAVAKDPDKRGTLLKIEQEVSAINVLLDRFERYVGEQRGLLKHLKDLEGFFLEDEQDALHLKNNIPPHMPKRGQQAAPQGYFLFLCFFPNYTTLEWCLIQFASSLGSTKNLNHLTETDESFILVWYLISSYGLKEVVHQLLLCPAGQFFIVEQDIREFAQLKVDKRFVGMLNMLRHCQRLREVRGGGLTRFILL